VVGQKETVSILKAYVKEKNMPNLLFAGPPGIGKTTAALALAHDLYGENYRESILELNASDERGIDVVRGKIKDFARTVSLSDVPFKIIFLDEADSLTNDAQNALRRTMELYLNVTRFILSANYSSKIIEPIQSRCSVFRFRPLKEEEVKEMLERVAHSEKLKLDKEAIDALLYVSEGDMRRAINSLQGAALHSEHVTADAVYKSSARAEPSEVKEMMELALSRKFIEARKKLHQLMINYGMSGEDVLLQMYRTIDQLSVSEREKVTIMDKIGEYNFRLVEGANEMLQIEALLAQMLLIK
jgi:replication factor C small subunit